MSDVTNAALRNKGLKPHFVGSTHRQIAMCTRCDQVTRVEDARFVTLATPKNAQGQTSAYYNRVELRLRCVACEHEHWVVAMPRDTNVVLDFFVDDIR